MGNVPSYCKTSDDAYITSKQYSLAVCEPESDIIENNIQSGDEFPGTCKFRDSTSKASTDSKIPCTLVADADTRSMIAKPIPEEKVTSEFLLGKPRNPNLDMQEFAVAESMFTSQTSKAAFMKEMFDFSSPLQDFLWKSNFQLESAFMVVFVLGSLLAIALAIYAVITYTPKTFYGGAKKISKLKINILTKK